MFVSYYPHTYDISPTPIMDGSHIFVSLQHDPDYSYYAYCVLCMEDQMEVNAGLRTEMTKRLLKKEGITIDHALKVKE